MRTLLRLALANTAFTLAASNLQAEEAAAGGRGAPVVLRLTHPERQLEAVLKLFEGSRAPHPAAALAAWKRASAEPERLGKTLEAVIAMCNPEMVREWRSLHEAWLELGFEPGEPRPRWRLGVPHDDGTLAALITAIRLSTEPPPAEDLGCSSAEPLGQSGAVAARTGSGVLMACSRTELDRALKELGRGSPAISNRPGEPGLNFLVEPQRLSVPDAGPVYLRRLIELGQGLGLERTVGRLAIEGDRVVLEALSVESSPAADAPRAEIGADWLDGIPARAAALVVALATDPRPSTWDRIFALADRVDRADPARANLAPLRVRLNVLAAAAGARLERDLWPHLRGLTLAVLIDSEHAGRIGSVIASLHLDGAASARRVRDELLPRIAAIMEGKRLPSSMPAGEAGGADSARAEPRLLGRLAGRPVEAALRGTTVIVGWGEGSVASAIRVAGHTRDSVCDWLVDRTLAEAEQGARPARFALFWPGRLSMAGSDAASPLNRSLGEGAPVVWRGWSAGRRARDRVEWRDLAFLVRRFLAAIPMQLAEVH